MQLGEVYHHELKTHKLEKMIRFAEVKHLLEASGGRRSSVGDRLDDACHQRRLTWELGKRAEVDAEHGQPQEPNSRALGGKPELQKENTF